MALLFAQDARQPHQRGCAGRGRTRICEPLVRVSRTLKIVTSKFSGFCLCENGGRWSSVRPNLRLVGKSRAPLFHDAICIKDDECGLARRLGCASVSRELGDRFPGGELPLQFPTQHDGPVLQPVARPLRVERAILLQHMPAQPAECDERDPAHQDEQGEQPGRRSQRVSHRASFYARLSGVNPASVTLLSGSAICHLPSALCHDRF